MQGMFSKLVGIDAGTTSWRECRDAMPIKISIVRYQANIFRVQQLVRNVLDSR
ncbi:hypothetical protein CY34DRAFT_798106 [Suillus luteus UH-Slu-Lm8-n1]|uniref:Uncharacterized protein n=1 Tax=Suillus luteus UH-Slu-Lm8-n1 TaxID=930992 RepID=A0A0D0AEC6_9AGAM|nr:hypothetical protein CY34DRAFT_798106 [Suillus luteus UH-Slu-Lm8-n1]